MFENLAETPCSYSSSFFAHKQARKNTTIFYMHTKYTVGLSHASTRLHKRTINFIYKYHSENYFFAS